MIGPEFRGEAQNAVGVVGKAAGYTLIIEIAERIAGTKINIAIANVYFIFRDKTAWGVTIFLG